MEGRWRTHSPPTGATVPSLEKADRLILGQLGHQAGGVSTGGVAQPSSAPEPSPTSSLPAVKPPFLSSSAKPQATSSLPELTEECAQGADNTHTWAQGRCEQSPHNQHPGTETPSAAWSAGCKRSQGAQKEMIPK